MNGRSRKVPLKQILNQKISDPFHIVNAAFKALLVASIGHPTEKSSSPVILHSRHWIGIAIRGGKTAIARGVSLELNESVAAWTHYGLCLNRDFQQ
nr:hypothetical protein Iba_chr04eCG3550 [Ipomoea batatas]